MKPLSSLRSLESFSSRVCVDKNLICLMGIWISVLWARGFWVLTQPECKYSDVTRWKQNINKHVNISVVRRKAHCQHYSVIWSVIVVDFLDYVFIKESPWWGGGPQSRLWLFSSQGSWHWRQLSSLWLVFKLWRKGKKKGRDAEEAETDEVKCGKVRTLWVVSDENKDVSWLLHHNFHSVMEVTFWVLWLFASVITHHSL